MSSVISGEVSGVTPDDTRQPLVALLQPLIMAFQPLKVLSTLDGDAIAADDDVFNLCFSSNMTPMCARRSFISAAATSFGVSLPLLMHLALVKGFCPSQSDTPFSFIRAAAHFIRILIVVNSKVNCRDTVMIAPEPEVLEPGRSRDLGRKRYAR